jgi:hypothetical protein
VALGPNTTVGNADGAALGPDAEAYGNAALAVGSGALANSDYALAVGDGASARNNSSVAVGPGANAAAAGGIAIGDANVNNAGAARVGGDQLVFGGARDTVPDADLAPNDMTVEIDEASGVFRLRGKNSNGNIIEGTVNYS